ncbi:LacI family DNA-binding transcriptional regulator [Marinimicrobium sp. ABcell2]|uniref:LacI family DNA-binding transcriptional regulator n=1 Tax=Marinimicrobium sp. ABcell2 TaxID=3069751 RepID=UPI0027AFC3BA|nr:LacI family DNA-binding transcriptional regulator [Marinimicrobium sp. ABcell2]MDQ2077713.1 LacI family DNA-binding transcriptional regulator [Marinimicrobium sp. ABcell2]
MEARKRGQSGRKATLVDVAERAKVSAITVSRVINHPDKVSDELRRRVQEAIDALGYIPNQSASSLASARSGVIGVAIPSLSNIVFNDVLRGIYDVAGASGYKVLLVDTHYSPLEEESMVRTLLSQSPEAMIITGGEQTGACQRMLKNANVPVVQMMELLENPLDMNVGFSHQKAGYSMAEQILKAGYQRVAFIGARMDQRVQQRLAGFREALEQQSRFDNKLVFTTPQPSSIALGGELFRSMMASTNGAVDAVFCCNDDLALGALFESQRMNINVPTEMGLCGFNDFEASAFVNPSLSSVYAPRYDMGVKAATMIVEVLKDEYQGEKIVDIGYEVRMRQSTHLK